MDNSGNVVVVGVPIKRGPTEPVIYDGNNDTIEQGTFISRQNIIISYSSEGIVNWNYRLYQQRTEVLGVCHQSSSTVLLIRVKETRQWVDSVGITRGWLPSVFDSLTKGYYLFHINSKGKHTRLERVFENEYGDLNIHDFKACRNGYVLTGNQEHGTTLCSEFQLTSESGDAGFILFLNKKGTPVQAHQAFFDFDGTSYYSSKFHIAVTNNSLYVAGVAVTKTKEFKKRLWKPYIACYSTKGDQLWVLDSPNIKAECMAICGDKEGVYVSYRMKNDTGTFYDIGIDAINFYSSMIVSVSSNGVMNWVKPISSSVVKDLALNNDELLLLGYFDISYKVGEIVFDSLGYFEKMFLATILTDGSLQQVDIIKLPTYRNHSFKIYTDSDNYRYIVGGMRNAKLNIIDVGFGDAVIYSHGPLIGKFRKSN
ncbi:MAG: hypothetical protein COA33_007555 [Fluviicola sp.]|nr:hypothetical protein [Fluviicola sp.]